MGISPHAVKIGRAGWAPVLVVLAAAIVYSAAPVGQTVSFNPDVGVGGYAGPITPIAEPVTLRITEAPVVEGRLRLEHSDPNLALPKLSEVRLQGSIRAEGAGFRFEANVPEILLDGRRLPVPGILLAASGLMDARGAWSAAEIDPLPQIRTPDKGKLIPVGGQLVGRKLSTGPIFNARPVRANDDLFASRELDRRLTASEGDDYSITRNTLSARARGLTVIEGRPYVVGLVAGLIEIVAKNGDAYQITPLGHILIDRTNGLPRGTIRATMAGIEGGRAINRSANLTFELLAK